MSARSDRRGRIAKCGPAESKKRLNDAYAHLELAETAAGDKRSATRNASVSAAVLAGIAASDAACCAVLGEVSRGENHRDAAELLGRIADGGRKAAKDLERLIAMKTKSQYGFDDVAPSDPVAAIRRAKSLVEFAEQMRKR